MGKPETGSDRRFTGRQITTCIVALCAAAILTPVSVTAASVAKTAIVDAQSPSRSVDVTNAGQVEALVSGKVGAVPGTPGKSFHREAVLSAGPVSAIGAAFPKGQNIAITSVNVVATGGVGGSQSQLKWREAGDGGLCEGTPVFVSDVVHFHLDVGETYDRTFPIPQIRAKTSKALCLVAASTADLTVIVDGYTY